VSGVKVVSGRYLMVNFACVFLENVLCMVFVLLCSAVTGSPYIGSTCGYVGCFMPFEDEYISLI